MASDPVLLRVVLSALSGEGQHVAVIKALDALDADTAGQRPEGSPHSVFQLLQHMIYWQELYLRRLRGDEAAGPAHAEQGWPGAEWPLSGGEWIGTVERFRRGWTEANEMATKRDLSETLPNWGGRPRFEGLLGLASHNSYHIGQVVIVRRMLGAWPPPGGGDSW
jgi:uncharacterized damage-inducible protein DinB